MPTIIKLVKKNNNQYKILLSDNTSLSFYNEVIIKYSLLTNKDINDNLLKELQEFNKLYEAYYKGLSLIKVKLRTKKELRNLLKKKNYNDKEIDFAIKMLCSQGYLDDENYVKCFIDDAYNIRNIGPRKIKYELEKLGISESIYGEYLQKFEDKWKEKIVKFKQKEEKLNHKYSSLILGKKIKEQLYNKGFYQDDINKYVVIEKNCDSKILKSIFQKELFKLKNKYSGNDLKIKLRNNLYNKGFKLTDIDNLINNNL